jgi:hypothetical protein
MAAPASKAVPSEPPDRLDAPLMMLDAILGNFFVIQAMSRTKMSTSPYATKALSRLLAGELLLT